MLGIAGRRRKFSDLSLPRFAACGAVGGLLLIAFPFALVAVGLASREGSDLGAWQIIAAISGPFILLSAVSASGSLMLARRAENKESLEAGREVAGLGPAERGADKLLQSRDRSLNRH